MSSLLKSTKKKRIPAIRKESVTLITEIEPKNTAYSLDEPAGEGFALKGD